MLISTITGMITGTVAFTGEGGFPERFINLCALNNIPLNELYCGKGILKGKTSVNGYKKMRIPAKRSGMRVRLTGKNGLPFFLRNNRKRVGVLVGAMIFAFLTFFLSTRIWSIEVEGNVTLRNEEIISVYEELGVRIGVAKRSLNIREIQAAAGRRMDRVVWTSLNIDGSTAVIEISEITERSVKISDGVPCNIVASDEGTVETVEAYTGKAEIKKGDGVRKGSLLVSGVTENKDGTVTFCPAEAYVTARTQHEYSVEIPFESRPQKTELIKKRYCVRVLNLKIPLDISFGNPEDCEVYASERNLSAGGKKLPVSVITKRYAGNRAVDLTLPENIAELEAYEELMHVMAQEMINAEITGVTLKKRTSVNGVTLSASVTCLENIGRKAKIDLDETG